MYWLIKLVMCLKLSEASTTSALIAITSPVSIKNLRACCETESDASCFREGGSNGLAASVVRSLAAAARSDVGNARRCITRRILFPTLTNSFLHKSLTTDSKRSENGRSASRFVRRSDRDKPSCSGCARWLASIASAARRYTICHPAASTAKSPARTRFPSAASRETESEISLELKFDLSSNCGLLIARSRAICEATNDVTSLGDSAR